MFVVLDYNDQDGLGDYILNAHRADLEAGRLAYYRFADADRFHMAHAKNMAHRCAMREGADILVTLDADNFTGPGFVAWIATMFVSDEALSYACPDFAGLPPHEERYNPDNPANLRRGFFGRMAIRWQDFIKLGGYNEVFSMWGGEDVDFLARMRRLGLKRGFIPTRFLNAIPHGSEVRFKEYPEAKQHENDRILHQCEAAQDTVVNYGKIGCGTVTKNGRGANTITIRPVPTRIFGIGMQRTGTMSLHDAFVSLGLDSGHWKSGDWAKAIWQEVNRWGHSRTLERDYCLVDNPIPVLYQKLDRAYPGSKFILTVRGEDEWLKSVRKLWTLEGNPRRWVWDIDGFTHRMHGIVYGQAEFDEATFRARYRQHNAEVMRYFAGRNDFLRIEVNERTTMDDLCEFIGRPMRFKQFPHRHKDGGTEQ